MMGRLTASWVKSFRQWERSTQTAFAIAVILMLVAFFTLLFAPSTIRQPALIGFAALLLTAQLIFMWGNRHMVTPYTQAQRLYLAEDFQQVRSILEELISVGKPDVAALTLLANTYRQLGMLDESEEVVKKALALRPFDPFPLYGFGRTLLVKGLYTQAAEIFQQAIDAGAPPIARFDLAEALYRQGLMDEARTAFLAVEDVTQEPFRELMTEYLLYRLGEHEKPDHQLIQTGLAYWQDHAERFRQTPYGQALAEDIRQMQPLMEEL